MRDRSIAVILSVALLGVGPCGVLPGGRLDGTVAVPPLDWSFVGANSSCQIEFDSDGPRSVNVGCYSIDGALYAHSHRWADTPRLFGESWAVAVSGDSDVRVLVAERIYDLRAELIVEPAHRLRILAARGFSPPPDGIRLFRLSPREKP